MFQGIFLEYLGRDEGLHEGVRLVKGRVARPKSNLGIKKVPFLA